MFGTDFEYFGNVNWELKVPKWLTESLFPHKVWGIAMVGEAFGVNQRIWRNSLMGPGAQKVKLLATVNLRNE